MPIPDKYKGKSYAEIAEKINDNYKDRYDSISLRGLTSQLNELRKSQEHKRQVLEARQVLEQEQSLEQVNNDPTSISNPTSNQGISPDLNTENNSTFNHSASQTYNNKFNNGGKVDTIKSRIDSLPLELQQKFYNDNLMLNDPLSEKSVNYNTYRESLLTKDRDKLKKYLEDNRINQSPEEYVKESFNNAKASFYSDDANILPIHNEVINNLELENEKLTDNVNRNTKNVKGAINKINNRNVNEINKIKYNKQIDSSTQQRLNSDINSGIRDENTDLYLARNEFSTGGDIAQAAPVFIDGLSALFRKRAKPVKRHLINTDFIKNLSNARTRENKFDKVDLNDIERGITEASGRFTQNNLNATNRNAGAFIANEQANQMNLYKAISGARMNAQVQDQNTERLNAGERARVDNFNLQNKSQAARLKLRANALNSQIKTQADIIDAQNEGAFQSAQNDSLNRIGNAIGSYGKQMNTEEMLGNIYGYDKYGRKIKNPYWEDDLDFLETKKEIPNLNKYGGLVKSIKLKRKRKNGKNK